MVADGSAEHLAFLLGGRVPEREFLHKAVNLRKRQLVGPVRLDGVLGGDDDERVRKGSGVAVDRHLAFLHGLEQCRLGLRRRAVDLVAENDIGEDGASLELELPGLLVKDVDPSDVRGEEVRRELDAAETTVNRAGYRSREHRLANAGDVVEEDVAAGQDGCDDVFNRLVVADDDAGDVVGDFVGQLGDGPDRQGIDRPELARAW